MYLLLIFWDTNQVFTLQFVIDRLMSICKLTSLPANYFCHRNEMLKNWLISCIFVKLFYFNCHTYDCLYVRLFPSQPRQFVLFFKIYFKFSHTNCVHIFTLNYMCCVALCSLSGTNLDVFSSGWTRFCLKVKISSIFLGVFCGFFCYSLIGNTCF